MAARTTAVEFSSSVAIAPGTKVWGGRDTARCVPTRPRRLTTLSWALYDLANTIFSMNIVSLYYSLYVVNVMHAPDAAYGYANGISMGLMFLTAPFLGALSDQYGKRKPFLILSTLACVSLTFFLGVKALLPSLALFVGANYAFEAGLVFYDSLLPEVSTPENRGRVGGLGIGLGYLGSFIGVGTGLLMLERIGYSGIFRLSAVLFLLFALPCFLFVRERGVTVARTPSAPLSRARNAVRQVLGTIREVKRFPGLGRFLIGRLFYADAVNTVIVFMGIYVTNEVGYSERGAQVLLLGAIGAAVLGGILWGMVVDRRGPKRTLDTVLILWIATLLGILMLAVLDLPRGLFWPLACAAGVALGGTWASDRPLMLALSPPEKVGEFYGLYSMVGRFASITGPVLWGVIVNELGLGRPAAVLALSLLVMVGFLILRPVRDDHNLARE
ncbi:MAG: MFS transporter [candidate division KSB1 bacterium]|nr:MFS transporter [candidate division KSB1 bacterium]